MERKVRERRRKEEKRRRKEEKNRKEEKIKDLLRHDGGLESSQPVETENSQISSAPEQSPQLVLSSSSAEPIALHASVIDQQPVDLQQETRHASLSWKLGRPRNLKPANLGKARSDAKVQAAQLPL